MVPLNKYTVIALCFLTIYGCGYPGDAYRQTHLSAKTALPIAVEMETLFPAADHFITHYGFPSEKTNTWNTEVFFGGRYELTMQIEVTVDYTHGSIAQAGTPVFYLCEVTDVRLQKLEGVEIPDVIQKFGFQTQFSEEEWKKVYDSHGDFTVIGIELNPEPVENFAAYTDAWRRPRIPISLLSK